MIIYSHREITLCLILSYHILIKMLLYLMWFWYLVKFKTLTFLLTPTLIADIRRSNNSLCLLGTGLTDISIKSCYQQLYLRLRSATKVTCLFHSEFIFTDDILVIYIYLYCLFLITSSIIPYSFASSADIQ